jgi:CrcB protein
MGQALLVGLGGFAGSVLRYLVSGYAQGLNNNSTFPLGTLAVNVLGCLAIGMLSQLADSRAIFTPEARLLVFAGLLGGFTTFSTFGNETLDLARNGQLLLSVLNVASHILLGLGAVWLGRVIASFVWQ